MSFYELLTTFIMPHLVDVNLFGGVCSQTFYELFVMACSGIVIHFWLFVPYTLILRLTGYKSRRKKK